MNKKTVVQMFLCCGTVLLFGCNSSENKQEAYGYRIMGDTVRILDGNWNKNIHVVNVRSVPYAREIVTAGKVCPIPTQYAIIAPPFAGRVVESYVHVGQFVTKNTPLFEINCPDFTSVQKDYFQAKSSYDLALKDLMRKKDLTRNGVSSQKELEESENTLLIAEKEYENAKSALNAFQVENPESMILGQPLVVRSPITGEVIENNLVNGLYLKDDAESVAVVADLSNIWISAQVKEKDIRFLKEGCNMDIKVAAWPDLSLQGKVFHIEEAVDEDTRSICVLSECKNEDERLKLGMYTTVHFMSDTVEMQEIPETALLQGSDENFVFVQLSSDTYVRRNVKVCATFDRRIIVEKGLLPGEKIIGEGGYYLKL